jgi:hypothetical protein
LEDGYAGSLEPGGTGILDVGQGIPVLGGNHEILIIFAAQLVRLVGLGIHNERDYVEKSAKSKLTSLFLD